MYRQKWHTILNIVRGLVCSVTNYTKERSQPYPLPRIGDVKRYFIRQRPYFIADFLIRSIIRTRPFNDYLGSLTNTPVIQQLLGCLTITAEQNASIRAKSTKPRRRIACSGVHLCAETGEKTYIKRFWGIEKVHRNSIKITVDLWQRTVIMIETRQGGATSI